MGHFQININDVEPAVFDGLEGFYGDPDIRFLIGADSGGSKSITFFRCVFPAGGEHARHAHPDAGEFLYVVRGTAAAGTGDEEQIAPAGTAIYSPKGSVHWIRNASETEELEFVGGYEGAADLDKAGYEFVSDITEEYRKAG
ncbi:MAG: cupin protein [Conexibacter sp.]|jgi:quercetin dioxygenase-like cupin family protein|nr:cupin protein [Conexibacter sp.]